MQLETHLITILLSILVLTTGFTAAIIGFFAKKINEKLDKNDYDHRAYDIRLAEDDLKLKDVERHAKQIEEHERRIDQHEIDIKVIKGQIISIYKKLRL